MIHTRLYIDGDQVPDTAEALAAGTPTALDHLTITSGRRNSLDQPDAGTLSATVKSRDETAARAFLNGLRPGATITARATYDKNLEPARPFPLTYLEFTGTATSHISYIENRQSFDTTNDQLSALYTYLSVQPSGLNPLAWDFDFPPLEPGTLVEIFPLRFEMRSERYYLLSAYLVSLPGPWVTWDAPRVALEDPSTPGANTIEKLRLPARGYPAVMFTLKPETWENVMETWKEAKTKWKRLGNVTLHNPLGIRINDPIKTSYLYSGVISAWEARKDGTSVYIDIDAVDTLALLDRAMIGGQPRPRETVSSRINWAIQQTGMDVPVVSTATRDPILEAIDVDHRSALDIIHEAASSTALSVFPFITTDGNAALLLEDSDARPASNTLTMDADGMPQLSPNTYTSVDAALVPASGVTIRRTSEETITQALVTYPHRSYDEEGNATDETLSVSTGDPGAAVLKIDTQLVHEADAIATGHAYLRRAPKSGWSIDGVTVTTARIPDLKTTARLISMNHRPGASVTVAPLPDWIPSATAERFIVEGATIVTRDNDLDISLTLTRQSNAGESITWGELPPALTWDKAFYSWAMAAGLIRKDH